MLKSFFGGDPTMSHFSAQVRYMLPSEQKRGKDGGTKRRREERAKLKELGFGRERYFQFRNNDEAGKAKAKAACEAYAKEWEIKSGIKLEVCEGCFL